MQAAQVTREQADIAVYMLVFLLLAVAFLRLMWLQSKATYCKRIAWDFLKFALAPPVAVFLIGWPFLGLSSALGSLTGLVTKLGFWVWGFRTFYLVLRAQRPDEGK